MSTVHVLCHAAGWCEQSKAALKSLIETRQKQPEDYYAVRWDGSAFPYGSSQDSTPCLQTLIQILTAENKRIFDHLYARLSEGGDNSNYNVPMEFLVESESTKNQNSHVFVKQGYMRETFMNNVFSRMVKHKDHLYVSPGTFHLFYMEGCEHAAEYLPLWEKAAQTCHDLRTGFYSFKKLIYPANKRELASLVQTNITDFPVVVFKPSNKVLVL